jgi:hypothetical protein
VVTIGATAEVEAFTHLAFSMTEKAIYPGVFSQRDDDSPKLTAFVVFNDDYACDGA